jgi:pSer/pThr/pTyr-binding forkhead associated (FHA) protein
MAGLLESLGDGPRIVLDKAITMIGRHPDCDVVLTSSRKISRKHCCVALVNNRYLVRDLGSMNGVWINGKRIERESEIRVGDQVAFGDVTYELLAVGEKRSSVKPNGKSGKRTKKSATRETPEKKPKLPLDLSQDFPIPIPDEAESFIVEQSINVTKDKSDPDLGKQNSDDSDDLYRLKSDDESDS